MSGAVQTALGTYSKTVVRRAGADRYATSAAVSAAAFPNGAATAYVASGEVFPDALSASSPAAITPAPLLLVRASCMPVVISQEIDRLKATSLVVVGWDRRRVRQRGQPALLSDAAYRLPVAALAAAAGPRPGSSASRPGMIPLRSSRLPWPLFGRHEPGSYPEIVTITSDRAADPAHCTVRSLSGALAAPP